MDAKEAARIVITKFPGRKAIGYWNLGDKFVIRTRPLSIIKNEAIPALFVVTKEGKTYGTNPMMFDLEPKDMIKF